MRSRHNASHHGGAGVRDVAIMIARTGGTGVPMISGVAYIWKTMNAAGTIHTASRIAA